MLEIIFQDEYYVAVNKPAGMLVHRSWLDRHETRFVMQTLRDQLGRHVFPLHRLDKPTSGVLVFALSSEIAAQTMPLFANHQMSKRYEAIVRGWMLKGELLDYPLTVKRDKIADKFSGQDKPPQQAITAYYPLATVELPHSSGAFASSRYTHLALLPQTGRKHQLRRHLHHLSHPIIGDTSYGDGKHNRLFREHYESNQLLLHASSLCFVHPFSGETIQIVAGYDAHWQRLLSSLPWQALPCDGVEQALTQEAKSLLASKAFAERLGKESLNAPLEESGSV